MITSPLRPRDQRQEPGIAARGQLAQPRNALRRFTFVRHHDASRASFRPALTETPQRNQPHWDRPVNSGPRPCLRCWIPPIGLQVRTHTPDLNVRARHTSGLAPRGSAFATTAASCQPTRLTKTTTTDANSNEPQTAAPPGSQTRTDRTRTERPENARGKRRSGARLALASRASAPRSCATDRRVVMIDALIWGRRFPGYVAQGTMLLPTLAVGR